jgi:aspartate kinase
MIVKKFGGTSVGNAQRLMQVAELTISDEKTVLVLSAVSGTTNTLVSIGQAYANKDLNTVKSHLDSLYPKYEKYISELYTAPEAASKAKAYIDGVFELLRSFDPANFSVKEEKLILAQGELMSTHMMFFYLESKGVHTVMLPALDYMRTEEGEPDTDFIRENIHHLMGAHPECKLFVTQGYICRNEFGEVDNLQRGGSDYTASLVGAALKTREIQIWTDIDGMHNNDPRVVDRTFPVREISFEEAAELAYFGAKILHPSSVLPAQKENIPVRLLNTMQPDAPGTVITSNLDAGRKVTAVAAKDGIVAIKIRSSRMLLAYGFLKQVFEVFEKYKTPIDMITTSEVAVTLSIDNTTHLEEILTELKKFGNVEFDVDQTIICVAGKFLQHDTIAASKVINALKNIPIRMISYGGSRYNISLLLHKEFKVTALKALNDALFFDEPIA